MYILNQIRLCFPVIVNHVTHILNCCIADNYFLEQWKIAYVCLCVIPLLKSTKVTGLMGLRPISILPTMSKVLESVMSCRQLREYLSVRDIFFTCSPV